MVNDFSSRWKQRWSDLQVTGTLPNEPIFMVYKGMHRLEKKTNLGFIAQYGL